MDSWLSDEACYLFRICQAFEAYIQHQHTQYRILSSVTKTVALVLHMLENLLDNDDVGDIFACGGSIVYKYTLLIYHALISR